MVDALNVIKLYPSTETTFTNNGLGYLPDATRCEVIEERNGAFELEMEYPVDGLRFNDIQLRSIIFAKPNIYDDPQPFRVYSISKPIAGVVTINAEHISYGMSGYPVRRFSSDNLATSIANINNGVIIPNNTNCPFNISSDFSANGEMNIEVPSSMRSLIGDSSNSLISIYGGELEFNRFNVILHENRGSDRGVSIRYGKNLTDVKQEENCSNVYTAVYPYYHYKYENDTEVVDTIITLEYQSGDTKKYYNGDGLVPVEGTFDFIRVLPLDVSSEWNNSHEWSKQFPSKDEIEEIALKYISDNNIGVPAVNITVSFEMLSQTEEYKNLSILEGVHLCDTVTVEFPKLGISAKSKCIKTTYNVITGKYTSIELGEAKSNLASSIVSTNQENQKAIESKVTPNFLNLQLENATRMISGNLGGYVIFHDTDLDGKPDEILIMDTPDIETATNVWRWNQAGLAHSSHGYNPDVDQHPEWRYDTAITQLGEIMGQFIAARTMSANAIKGGTFIAGGLDNQSGVIQVVDSVGRLLVTIDKNGITFANDDAITIKWSQLDDIPSDLAYTGDIPTSEQITEISRNSVTSENIKGTYLQGKEIRAGGTNNQNGTIKVRDAEGNVLILIDNNGITLNNDSALTISWAQLSNVPSDLAHTGDIPTKTSQLSNDSDYKTGTQVTQISQDSVTSENIKGTYLQGKEIRATENFQMDTYYNAYYHGYEPVIQSGWSDYSVVLSVPILKIGNSRPLYFTQWPVVYGSGLSILGASGIDSMIWTESQSKGKYIHVNTSIDGAYGITVWASDTRLKKNIKDTEQTSLDKIKQIRFIQFDWKSNDAHVDLGISANELEKIVPEAIIDVKQNPDDKYESLKNIDTSMMVVYALKAIQEQQSEIEELKKQVNKLMSLIEERM